MIKILAIGNSFSEDATYYLYQIAKADSVDMKVVNLNVGGCSLETHWKNIQNNAPEYRHEENGSVTGKYVSIEEALKSEQWDYVITQQASHDSGLVETYQPYLENIISFIKECVPNAKIYLHETWAYELDSLHSGFVNYHQDQFEMYDKISTTYKTLAEQFKLGLIKSGDVIQELRKREPFIYGHGGMSLCRDGFHMNLIYGRYLLSAIWYKTFTNHSIINNTYIPSTHLAPNAICDEKVLSVIKEIVDEMI